MPDTITAGSFFFAAQFAAPTMASKHVYDEFLVRGRRRLGLARSDRQSTEIALSAALTHLDDFARGCDNQRPGIAPPELDAPDKISRLPIPATSPLVFSD